MEKSNLKVYIEKAKKYHGDKYDYSNTVYNGAHSKVEILCKQHGPFTICANDHIKRNRQHGCQTCGKNKYIDSIRCKKEEFIERATKLHNHIYDYSKINYIDIYTKIEILCHKHGSFLQVPYNHLHGSNCIYCGYETNRKSTTKTLEMFILEANETHNNKYVYSNTKYISANKKIEILCPKHGPFLQAPNVHLKGHGCPKCNSSKGELKIANWLTEHNISFKYNTKFKNCRNPATGYILRFDFYLPDLNILIEFDGWHHFEDTPFGNYKDINYRDEIKNTYAIEHNTDIIRIHYKNINNISSILTERLLSHEKNICINTGAAVYQY